MKSLWAYAVALLGVALLAGCGGDSSSDAASEGSSEIVFESPAIGADGVISPGYECGGGSIWLPLRWSPAPEGTKELVLYFGRYHYVKRGNEEPRVKVPFGILVTKLDPARRGVNALPQEAESTLTYHPFQSCVPQRGQNIILQLFALGRPLPTPEADTDTVYDMVETLLGEKSGQKNPRWVKELTEESLATAQIKATYRPK